MIKHYSANVLGEYSNRSPLVCIVIVKLICLKSSEKSETLTKKAKKKKKKNSNSLFDSKIN